MKCVIWTDDDGYKHASKIRDGDSEVFAKYGIPCDPPDLNLIDWREVQKELHNRFIDQGLLTWKDVMFQGSAIQGILSAVIKSKIVALYRTSPNGGDIKEAT